jgi:hypothetical protein
VTPALRRAPPTAPALRLGRGGDAEAVEHRLSGGTVLGCHRGLEFGVPPRRLGSVDGVDVSALAREFGQLGGCARPRALELELSLAVLDDLPRLAIVLVASLR